MESFNNRRVLCSWEHAGDVSYESEIVLTLQVTGHEGPEALEECLKGAEVVVIPAGVPRKPGTLKRLIVEQLPAKLHCSETNNVQKQFYRDYLAE